MSHPLSFSLDTQAATTTIPMIRDGHHATFRLTSLEQVNGEKGASAKFIFDLVEPAPTTDGGQIVPGGLGAKQFVNIQFYSKPDAKDPAWFVKKASQYVDALLGTGDVGNQKGKPSRPQFFNLEAHKQGVIQVNPEIIGQLVGKTLVAKMKVKTGDYEGNEFGNVMFPGDVKA